MSPTSDQQDETDAGVWSQWAAHLVDVVLAMADGESVLVTAPAAGARPARLRKARLGGVIPARHESTAPWVRLHRAEHHLRGFCIGSQVTGGTFPLAPEEDAALRALGWHHPPKAEGTDYIRFWPDDVPQGPFLPRDEADRAAEMVGSTFRVVLAPGADPPSVTG